MRNGDFYRATRMLRVYQTGMKAAGLSFFPSPLFSFPPFLFSRSTLGCDRIPIGGRAFAIHVSRDLCNIGQWTRSNFALGFARRATWVADRCCDRTFAVDASTVRVESSIYRENVSKPFFFSSFFARNREREYIYIRIPNLDTS